MQPRKRPSRPIDQIKRTVARRPYPKLTERQVRESERKKIEEQRGPNKQKVLAVSERMGKQATIVVNQINVPKTIPTDLLREKFNPRSRKMERYKTVSSGEFELPGLHLEVMVAPPKAFSHLNLPKNIEIVPGKPLLFVLFKKIKETRKGRVLGLKGVNALYDLEGHLLGYIEPPVN